jgi:protein SCO1
MKWFAAILVVLLSALAGSAHDSHDRKELTESASAVGLEQRLGESIPLDLKFNDENGRPVVLGELIRRPTVLTLVYFHCPNVCSLLLQNVADVLNRMPAEPGKEYTVLSISFDETETADFALERKKVYLQMIEKPFPPDAWRFLTGNRENIKKLTDAAGFHFKRVKNDFEHPVAMIILGPDGKIIRYLFGTNPLPFDLKIALLEASQGKIGPAIAKVVQFCFSYDPKANKLVFNLLRVTGSVTVFFAVAFVAFLLLKGKKGNVREDKKE